MPGVGDAAAIGSLVSGFVTVTRVGSVFAGVLVPPLEERRHCGRSVRPQRARRCTGGPQLQPRRDCREQPRRRSTLHALRRAAIWQEQEEQEEGSKKSGKP